MGVGMKCEDVRRAISDYVEGDGDASLRRQMDRHFNASTSAGFVRQSWMEPATSHS